MVEVPRWGTVIVSALLMTSHVLRNRRAADRPEHGRPAVRAPALTGRRAGQPRQVTDAGRGSRIECVNAWSVSRRPPMARNRPFVQRVISKRPRRRPSRRIDATRLRRKLVTVLADGLTGPGGPVQPTNKPAGALRTLPSVVRALRRAGRSARRQTTTTRSPPLTAVSSQRRLWGIAGSGVGTGKKTVASPRPTIEPAGHTDVVRANCSRRTVHRGNSRPLYRVPPSVIAQPSTRRPGPR